MFLSQNISCSTPKHRNADFCEIESVVPLTLLLKSVHSCFVLSDCPQENILLSGAADPEAQAPSEHGSHQRDPRYISHHPSLCDDAVFRSGFYSHPERFSAVISEGIDFYYASKQNAQKMVDFLQCTVPCRYETQVLYLSGT